MSLLISNSGYVADLNHHLCVPSQLPYRTGPQTTHTRLNIEQNKQSLIQISHYRFSLVISGLTKRLQKINEVRNVGEVSTQFIPRNVVEREISMSMLMV